MRGCGQLSGGKGRPAPDSQFSRDRHKRNNSTGQGIAKMGVTTEPSCSAQKRMVAGDLEFSQLLLYQEQI